MLFRSRQNTFTLKLVAGIAILLAICLYYFPANRAFLYTGMDGHYAMLMPRDQPIFSPFIAGLTNNFMQGRGGILLMNSFFDIMSLPFIIAGNDIDPVISFTILTIMYFCSVILLLSSFCHNLNILIISSFIACGFSIPFVAFSPLYFLYSNNPLFGITAIYTFINAYFWRTALTCSGIRCIFFGSIAGCILFVNVLLCPMMVMLWAPFCLALVMPPLTSRLRSLEWRNIVCSLGPSILIAIPLSIYLYGLFAYSGMFKIGTPPPIAQEEISILFSPKANYIPHFQQLVFCLFLLGGLFVAAFAPRGRRLDAAIVLLWIGVMVFAGYYAQKYGILRKPRLVYIEMYFYPLYAFFIVYGATLAGGLLARTVPIRYRRKPLLYIQKISPFFGFLVGPLLLFGFLIFAPRLSGTHQQLYPYPPKMTKIITYLHDNASLTPGEKFRGRVFSLFSEEWTTIELDHLYKVGNDYDSVGLWYYHIPTFFEYSHLRSSLEFLQSICMKGMELPYLANFYGVKYVLSDTDIRQNNSAARLVVQENFDESHHVYLFELNDPNLGDLHPYRPVNYSNYHDFISGFKNGEFDPTVDFWSMDISSNETFIPANKIEVRISREGLHVIANSNGKSVVILPLEFSQCLNIVGATNDQRLFMANFGETGIQFSNSLDVFVKYENGPFINPLCRIDDARTFSKLFNAQ